MFNQVFNIFIEVYKCNLEYRKTILLTIVSSLSIVVCSIIFTICFEDKLFGRFFGTYIPPIILGVILYILLIVKKCKFKVECCKYALLISLPLAFHLLSGTILNSSDRIMITNVCGESYNALYSVAYLVVSIIIILWNSINNAWTPWFFDKLYLNQHVGLRKYIILILIIGFGICFIFLLFSKK